MKTRIPAHGEQDSGSLRLIVWSADAARSLDELTEFGIHLLAGGVATQEDLTEVGSADVALVDPGDCDAAMVANTIQQFKATGLAVVVLVDLPTADREFLLFGADVVGARDCSPPSLALLIRSAFRSFCIRRELEEQVNTLRRKLDETKLIGRAKAIVAERLRISEADAFRNLRREARNRRRPLHELAQIVIDAHEMMSSIGCQPAQAPLAQRVARVKTPLSKVAVPKMPDAFAALANTVLGNNDIPSGA